MPAYLNVDDDGRQEVVFYSDNGGAVRGLDYLPDRAPQFDQYEEQGYLPPEVMIENHWILECDWCGRRSDDEEWMDDEDGEGDTPVIDTFHHQFYFCCPSCFESWKAERVARKAAEIDFKAMLNSRFPGLEVLDVQRYGTKVEAVLATCKFPGGEGTLTQTEDGCYMRTREIDAWNQYLVNRPEVAA